jgi:hypothetical protein
MRKAMVLVVIGLAGTFASPAFAEDDFRGFRLGMNLNSDQLEGDFAFQGLGVQPVNNNRFGYGLFGGWGFNRYFAVEGGLHLGGKFNTDARLFVGSVPNVPPSGGDTFDDAPYFKVSNSLRSIDASVVGSFWIGDKFSFFGRLGGMGWKAETRYAYGDVDGAGVKTFDEIGDNGFAPMGGLGVQTVLDRALMRFEYQYVDLGDLPVGTYFGQFENTMESFSFSIVWTIR